ncbi:stage II sporulation protein D [Brevibacillus aydinogluensis]|jgi:stage II sporulation protein D|uniref:Stage II sporulation protein D n=1 Tax=Brevibacillus aydinogluensis TaxID=927786 RepID=A0AA48M8H2_9BACL|nr:stage II sporulation protein D [Brevibacillus aydinogluensis]CAJ1000952.1 stage II sporulation protein D [Brevibacillus aydinogluensis]
MKRYLIVWFIGLPILLVLMPAALVTLFSPLSDGGTDVAAVAPHTPSSNRPKIEVKVYRTNKKTVETVPLETYVEGVVAAEMPAEFEIEALKAQAMAARTYIVRRLSEKAFGDVPEGAHVLDTVKHQAYLDEQQRRELWKEQFDWKNGRIRQAVQATAGVVLTYQGEPIDATFFSTSNGFTENAGEYFEKPVPYLKSVASPWDIQSPSYEKTQVMTVADLEQKLGVRIAQEAASGGSWYRIVERTTGNRVGKISIGGKEFSGREFRERLGLNSSAFTMELQDGKVYITTKGYGHGVGMSQWGANGMAKAGKNAEQIVKYFYQGISLEDCGSVLKS